MRRVLACIGIAAAALIAAQGTANAAPTTGDDVSMPQQGRLVINEVQTRGPAGTMDQFVEILNPSRTTSVDLTGWIMRIYSPNNIVLQTVFFPEGASLLPLGAGPNEESIWTISSEGFTGGEVSQPGAITNIPSNGGVALFNPGAVTKVDGVAFSSRATTPLEGVALAPQPANLDEFEAAYGRDIVGRDSNINRSDFLLQLRSPNQLN